MQYTQMMADERPELNTHNLEGWTHKIILNEGTSGLLIPFSLSLQTIGHHRSQAFTGS